MTVADTTTSDQQQAEAAPKRRSWQRKGKIVRCMALIREMSPEEVLRVEENIQTWKRDVIRRLGGTV